MRYILQVSDSVSAKITFSYLEFLLLHADFRVLLSRRQSSCQSLLPLALGPFRHRGGDRDGRLYNVNWRVFWQIIQLR